MTLPQPLAALGQYNQWITYVLVPRKDGSGRMDKKPTDWRTGRLHDAHDPAIWTDYATAWLAGGGHTGFVFTEHDPFWFLDVDNCVVSGKWSLLALDLIESLPGAAWEVSISGTGLHGFGTGILPLNHGNKGAGVDLYTTRRFCAVTGINAIGDATTDCTVPMREVIAKFFSTKDHVVIPADWTNGPSTEWRGSVDDNDLIRRACNSRSIAGAFQGKASFAQLWDADALALGRSWPDPVRAYDASGADAALAQHLMFWTGKDCVRVDRLMRMSRLARDKWQRDDYMQRTILGALAQARDVCIDKPVELPAPVVSTTPQPVTGETVLTLDDQLKFFAGCIYVADVHGILMPGGAVLKEGQFNAVKGGYSFVFDNHGGKLAKKAWECFTDSKAMHYPKVDTMEFAPQREPGAIWRADGAVYVNTYYPAQTRSLDGDVKPFLQHLARILPVTGDRDTMLAYMAAVIQYPGFKFQWSPVIQGCEGNGKTLLSRCLREAVGLKHYHMARPEELNNRFNGFLLNRIFVSVEDIFKTDNHDEVIEALSKMITNDYIEVEAKGGDKVTRKVCANFVITCNPKDAVRKTINSRKYAVFYTPQQSEEDLARDGMAGDYFPRLYAWLRADGYAIVNRYLRQYVIPDALNPATECHRAPITSSTNEAVTESAGRLEQEITHAIDMDECGFRGGWISSHFLDKLIQDRNMEAKYPRNKRRTVLIDMGYAVHPGLPDGQCNNSISPDGVRSRLYVKRNHGSLTARGAAVMSMYTDAQVPAPVVALPGLRLAG